MDAYDYCFICKKISGNYQYFLVALVRVLNTEVVLRLKGTMEGPKHT